MSMQNMNRRGFLRASAGLAGAGMAASLASCQPGSPPASVEPTPAEGAAPEATSTVAAPAIKYADKACVFRYITGGYTQAGPDDDDIKAIQEEALRQQYGLNVDIQYESASWNDIDALIETRMQTQGCDAAQRYAGLVMKWVITPGLIRDIDDAMRTYGQHLIEELPASGYQYFQQGSDKYNAIPMMYSTPGDCEYLTIRRDWCNKVDRDVPTTYEELEECLRLFKEKGLGGDVTIPCTVVMSYFMNWAFYGPWTAEPAEQLKMLDSGKSIFLGALFHPQRLEMLQRWVKDGLFNKEWGTWKDSDNYSAMSKGMVGCINDGWWIVNGTIQDTVVKDDPSQDWVQIFPPLGLKGVPNSGRISFADYQPIERAIVVTSWAQCPEAIVALADWENSSFENHMLGTYGIEGKHWKYGENGCIVDMRTPAPNSEYSGMRWATRIPKWSVKANMLPSCPDRPPLDPMVNERIYRNLNTRSDGTKPQQGEYPCLPTVDRWCPYTFTKSLNYLGDLDTLYNEYQARIINGELEVEAGVKEFWEKWYAAGGDVKMEEQTEQWQAFSAAHPEWKDPKATFAPEFWNTEIKYPEPPKST